MLTIDGVHDALENLGVERCWVFLETLRLALITSLSRSEAWSWPMFIVRTCPMRLSELELAMGLERVYESLARKLQVVVVDVA
jgi:hypothetical protein